MGKGYLPANVWCFGEKNTDKCVLYSKFTNKIRITVKIFPKLEMKNLMCLFALIQLDNSHLT